MVLKLKKKKKLNEVNMENSVRLWRIIYSLLLLAEGKCFLAFTITWECGHPAMQVYYREISLILVCVLVG